MDHILGQTHPQASRLSQKCCLKYHSLHSHHHDQADALTIFWSFSESSMRSPSELNYGVSGRSITMWTSFDPLNTGIPLLGFNGFRLSGS